MKSILRSKKLVSILKCFFVCLAFILIRLPNKKQMKNPAACSPNDNEAKTCAFVTISIEIETTKSTEGLQNTIGNEIMSLRNSGKFKDGLDDEVASCDGTIQPTPAPTASPTVIKTVTYNYVFDIEYSISCFEEYLDKELSKELRDSLKEHESYEIDPQVQESREYLHW